MAKGTWMAVCLAVCLFLPAKAYADYGLYAEIVEQPSDTGMRLIAFGTAENYNCGEAPGVDLDVYLFGPASQLLNSNAEYSPLCYAQAETDYTQSYDSWMDGDYEARATVPQHGCASDQRYFEKFQAVFERDHFNALINKWVYESRSHICTHACQPPRVCSSINFGWASVNGVRIATPHVTRCQWGGKAFVPSQPPCNPKTLGFYLGGFNDECS